MWASSADDMVPKVQAVEATARGWLQDGVPARVRLLMGKVVQPKVLQCSKQRVS